MVSTSDEEADTVKDRFWRNLEEGQLPDNLCRTDLYSAVGRVKLIIFLLIGKCLLDNVYSFIL